MILNAVSGATKQYRGRNRPSPRKETYFEKNPQCAKFPGDLPRDGCLSGVLLSMQWFMRGDPTHGWAHAPHAEEADLRGKKVSHRFQSASHSSTLGLHAELCNE